MNLYLDTSLIVALLAPEEHSTRAEVWLKSCQDRELIVSDWVTTEVSAALSSKARLGLLTQAAQEETTRAYFDLCKASLATVPVTRAHFERATLLAGRSEAGLRGGDALHLAIATAQDAAICTLDKQFARACDLLELQCELV